jgi:ATP-dependent protease Clp ATPase subunit
MRCSFCWEEIGEGRCVASGTVYICLKCIAIGAEIVKEAKKKEEEKHGKD